MMAAVGEEEEDQTVCEFLQQNQGLAAWAEGLRGHHETEKQWRLRRQFILRNMEQFNISKSQPAPPTASSGLDRLLALSMVWVNHVFMGCRYSKEVMDKVLEMGEDIKVKDAPSHTLRGDIIAKKLKKSELATSKDILVATTKDEQVADKVKKRELPDSKEAIGEQPCPKKQLVKEDAPGGFALTSEDAGNGDQDVCLNRIPGLDGFSTSGPSDALSKPQEDAQDASTANSNQTQAPKGNDEKLIVTQESDHVCHQQPVPSQPVLSAQTMAGPSGEAKYKVQPNIQDGSRSVESSPKVVPSSGPQKLVQNPPIAQKSAPTVIPQKSIQTPAPQKPVPTSIPQKPIQTPSISQKPVPTIIPQKPVPIIIQQKSVPSVIPQKPIPTIIPQKPIPNIIPQKPVPTIIPQKSVSNIIPQKPIPMIIPQKPIPNIIPQKPVPTIIPQKPILNIIPQKPVPMIIPQKPILNIIPQKLVPTIIPQKPILNIIPQKSVPTIIPQKPIPNIMPQKPVPTIIPQKPVPNIIPQKPVPTIPQKPVSTTITLKSIHTPLLQKLVQTSIPKKAVQASVPLRDVQALVSQRSAQVSIPQRAVQTPTSQSCKTSLTGNIAAEVMKEKQTFYNKLYKAIAWKLVSAGGFSNDIKHLEMLNNCIEAAKNTLDSVYVPLKDISELHLPQSSAREGIVCELRCKSVYLATGYGKCKVSATEMAAKEAVKLFLKHKVTVKICKRRFKGNEIEDLVLLCEELPRLNLAPALINPLEPCAR